MGIIKRQGLKSSIVNYAGVLIGVVFFNFIFPHLISTEHLGLINLLRSLMIIFSAIFSLGLGQTLLRYYLEWDEASLAKSYHRFAIKNTLISLLVFVVIIVVFKASFLAYYQKQSPLFVPYYYYLIPLVILYTFTGYLEMYSLVKMRTSVPAFLREIVNRVILIVVFYLFIHHSISQDSFVWGFVLSYALPLLVLMVYVYKVLDFGTESDAKFRKRVALKEEMMYTGHMFLLITFSYIHNFLDGIIIPAFLGLEALGIYTPALVLGQMIQVPYRAVALISIPVLREALVKNDIQKVETMNRQIAINLFLIGAFLFTLLVSNADGIFGLIPAKFSAAKHVLIIVACGRLLDMAFGLNSEIINYSKHYKAIMVFSGIMMAMTILLNIILIPKFGLDGAAYAVSISLVVFNLIKTAYIYHVFGFHCFSMHYLSIILISGLILGLMYFIPFLQFVDHHMFLNACCNIAFRASIGGVLFLGAVYFLKVSEDLNHFIRLILSGKIFKGGHRMEEL